MQLPSFDIFSYNIHFYLSLLRYQTVEEIPINSDLRALYVIEFVIYFPSNVDWLKFKDCAYFVLLFISGNRFVFEEILK